MLITLKKLCERCAPVVSFVTKIFTHRKGPGHKVHEVAQRTRRNTIVDEETLSTLCIFVAKYLFVAERSGHKVHEVCTKDTMQ